MKTRWFQFFDKMIILLLGGLGVFSGCDILDTPVEYGMPHAGYELKGTVTQETTAQPIRNIRVVRPLWIEPESDYAFPSDTVYTDANGKYAFVYDGFPQSKYRLKFEDIDGAENGGLFQTKEIEGEFTKDDQVKKGNGHWYSGQFVKTQDVTLAPYSAALYGVRQADFQP